MKPLGLILMMAVLMGGADAWADEAPCQTHHLEPTELKQRLRRWRGMSPFLRWRLIEVRPATCAVKGAVPVDLVLRPPAGWSAHKLAYRVNARMVLDQQSGQPMSPTDTETLLAQTAAGARRLIRAAEQQEDFHRFIERYGPVRAEIGWDMAPPQLRMVLRSERCSRCPPTKLPELVLTERAKDLVVAYQLPRIDGLPARRELLRFVESISSQQSACRAIWIEAHWLAQPQGDELTEGVGSWMCSAVLSGEGCPRIYSKVVTDELEVLE